MLTRLVSSLMLKENLYFLNIQAICNANIDIVADQASEFLNDLDMMVAQGSLLIEQQKVHW